MKKLLITGWAGTIHGIMASHTIYRMHEYCLRHDASFSCVNLASDIPASWVKVPNLIAALQGFDLVLWLDCDVVVANYDESIFDDFDRDASQALVIHQTECGPVPNCGVWLVAKPMLPVLEKVWQQSGRLRNHPWWEQAAVMEQMGFMPSLNTAGWPYSVDAGETELRQYTQFLDATWNDHPRDSGRVESPNFIHVTQYDDRLGTIRRLCAH
jgi:hypothetical protein